MSMTIHEKLSKIQAELKVGKPRYNKFAGFSYRNTEDIFEAIKPLLDKHGLHLLLDEEMVVLGNQLGSGTSERFYKKVTAAISDGKERVSATSFTREDESQKGLTSSQLSGACGSYGAKMALRGLLLLDDVQDDDHDKSGDSSASKTLAPSQSTQSAKTETKTEQSTKVEQPSSSSFRRKPKAEPVKQMEEDDDY